MISSKAKGLIRDATNAYRRHNETKGAKELNKRYATEPLTSEQVEEIKDKWSPVGRIKNSEWHRYYAHVNGFDPRYVPPDIYASEILPRTQNLDLASSWADKAYFHRYFPDVKFPTAIAYVIDGILMDAEYTAIDRDQLGEKIASAGKFIVKPTLESGCGRGVELVDVGETGLEGALGIIDGFGDNFAVQELIEQHESLAVFNPSSVNVLRIYTIRLDGSIIVLDNSILRFGIEGSHTDITFVDGREIANYVGVASDGTVMDFVADTDGVKRPIDQHLLGIAVPSYAKACEIATSVHERLHHFDIVGFDFSIGSDGEPVMIEYNLKFPGVSLPQFVRGPFFGEHTEKFIDSIEGKNPRRA